MRHQFASLPLRRHAAFLAILLLGSVLLAGVHPVKSAAASTPAKGSGTFTLLAVYRGAVKKTSYTLWTPVKNIEGDRPWLASLQREASDVALDLKVPALLQGVRDAKGRTVKPRVNSIYRISGTMVVPVSCTKPIKKEACGSPVVLRIANAEPVTGACKEHEYYSAYTYVCGTSDEVVGIMSHPDNTKRLAASHIEGRTLRMSGRGSYPIPFGGRIDGSLATGSIPLPTHARGTCTVEVNLFHYLDGGSSKRHVELSKISLKYRC